MDIFMWTVWREMVTIRILQLLTTDGKAFADEVIFLSEYVIHSIVHQTYKLWQLQKKKKLLIPKAKVKDQKKKNGIFYLILLFFLKAILNLQVYKKRRWNK